MMKNEKTNEFTVGNTCVFLDTIGRTIVGQIVEETTTEVSVQDPLLVLVQPRPDTGQLQMQLVPLFFKEFCEDPSPVIWSYKKNNITTPTKIALSSQFVSQYKQAITPQAPATESQTGTQEPKVVKLFDE